MLYVGGWEEAEGRFSHVSEIDCQISKRALHPLEVGLQVYVSCPGWILGTELWYLQEQYTLLTTETFLWPLASQCHGTGRTSAVNLVCKEWVSYSQARSS